MGMDVQGLVVKRKERQNNKGPLVYRYKPVPTVNEGVTPPSIGKVDVLNKFRAVERSLNGNLDIVGGLLERVLDGFFRRHEIDVEFRGDYFVQHLVEDEQRGYRGVSGVDVGRGQMGV